MSAGAAIDKNPGPGAHIQDLRRELDQRTKSEVCAECGGILLVAFLRGEYVLRCGACNQYGGPTKSKHEPSLKQRYRQARSLEGAGMTYIEAMNLSYTLKREIDRAESDGKKPNATTVGLLQQLEAEMTGQTASQALAIPTTRQAVTYTAEEVEIIKQQIAVGVSDKELELFLATAQRRGLDPFARQIYAVSRRRKNQQGGWENYMVMQTGIDGYRIIAARSGSYAGQSRPEFGPLIPCGECVGGHHPEWAEVTVFKMVLGQRVPTVGLVYWDERVQTTADGKPNSMWRSQPRGQLAKCAEALALRKDFPEELSDLEYGEGRGLDAAPEVRAMDEADWERFDSLHARPPLPEHFDPETGEIVDGEYTSTPDDETPDSEAHSGPTDDADTLAGITADQIAVIKGLQAMEPERWTTAALNKHCRTDFGRAVALLTEAEAAKLITFMELGGSPRGGG